MSGAPEPVRIDKWLWAARFFKTRALAVEAIGGGKVDLNGERAKPSRVLKPGDQVRVRLGPFEHVVTVLALARLRGPAAKAALLYQEDPASRARRLALAEAHRLARESFRAGEGRPSKKERREIERFKKKW